MDFIGPAMGGNVDKSNPPADYPSIVAMATLLADQLKTVFIDDGQEFGEGAFYAWHGMVKSEAESPFDPLRADLIRYQIRLAKRRARTKAGARRDRSL